MSGLELIEHKSASYSGRTWHNASQGVTVAIATNFYTAGERLTHKAAGERYLALGVDRDIVMAAREIWKLFRRWDCNVLNVAGNGIYTLSKNGLTQQWANQYVYSILKVVKPHWPIHRIVSGGQTGIDMAGLVAGVALGIHSVGTFPKGFKMRGEDGVDRDHDPKDIMATIHKHVDELVK